MDHKCDECDKVFSRSDSLKRHKKEAHHASETRKRTTAINEGASTSAAIKRARNDEIIYCDICAKNVEKNLFTNHCRSRTHRVNARCPGPEDGVFIIRSEFKDRIVSYCLNLPEDKLKVDEAMITIKDKIKNLINERLVYLTSMKINFELFGLYVNQKQNITDIKSFQTKYQIVSTEFDFELLYDDVVAILDRKESEFTSKDSGLSCITKIH